MVNISVAHRFHGHNKTCVEIKQGHGKINWDHGRTNSTTAERQNSQTHGDTKQKHGKRNYKIITVKTLIFLTHGKRNYNIIISDTTQQNV